MNRSLGNAKHLGQLPILEPPEVMRLDQLGFASVQVRQRFERGVDCQHIGGRIGWRRGTSRRIQGDKGERLAPLLPLPAPRVIHENPPHGSRRHIEKVRAVLPVELDVQQALEGLVDQRSRLERVRDPLAPHVSPRDVSQLVIDQRHELIECRP